MENFFSWFQGVNLTFSDFKFEEGVPVIYVLLSRFDGKKFDYILTFLPELHVIDKKGFADEEVKYWLNYAEENKDMIWDLALERLVEWLA